MPGGGPLIFVTIGTHEPFDRLVRAMDEWCKNNPQTEVFGQIILRNRSNYRPRHFETVEKLTPSDYRATYERANLIVAHAGMGSIITALTMRKRIVVMPRRGHLRETRNDHQFATVKHLSEKPGIFVALDERELPHAIDAALASVASGSGTVADEFAQSSLIGHLRDFIFDAGVSQSEC